MFTLLELPQFVCWMLLWVHDQKDVVCCNVYIVCDRLKKIIKKEEKKDNFHFIIVVIKCYFWYTASSLTIAGHCVTGRTCLEVISIRDLTAFLKGP